MNSSKSNIQDIDIIRDEDQLTSVRDRAREMNIYAVIPLRSDVSHSIDQNEILLKRCVKSLNESNYINKVVVTADNEEMLELGSRFQNSIKILRPIELSSFEIRLNRVLQYTLEELIKIDEVPDILVPAEITYPFRPEGIFDNVIEMLLNGDYDTVIAGMTEYRVCWKITDKGFESVMDTSKPRYSRSPLHIGLPSLATAIYPNVVQKGKRYGDKIGIFEVNGPFDSIEIRTEDELEQVAKMLYWPS